MFRFLPQPPPTYTTLQIPCVACQEVFTVAEDSEMRADAWRLPPDHQPTIHLRYEENRTQQPMRSLSRSDPGIDASQFGEREPDTYVNCPRCGADNRNWLQIMGRPGAIPWRKKFPAAFRSILVACALAPITLLMALAVQDSVAWAFLIAGAVVLAAGLTAVDLTSNWLLLRIDNHIQNALPGKRRSREAYLWRRGVLIIILLSFLIPLVFFLMAPRAFRFVNTILNPTPRSAAQLGQTRVTQINDDFAQFSIESIEVALQRIERIQEDEAVGPEEAERRINEILDGLAEDLTRENERFTALVRQDVDEQIESLELYIEETQELIDARRLRQDRAAIAAVTARLSLLLLWWLMVGLSCLVSVFMSMAALKSYVAAVDNQLPRPIFTSIADMTRLVAWEAKRSLQINGNLNHIQWVEVYRNEKGGINLIGLHRDEPDVDPITSMVSRTVRAQKYMISTDMWGRIRESIIRDVRLPRTVFLSQHQAEAWPDQVVPPPPDYITISPSPPPGDELAQQFFAVPPTPPHSPEQEVGVKAVSPQPANGDLGRTAVQPAPQPQPTYPTVPESPIAGRDRLCEELARILSEKFTENELRQLYAALNFNYVRFRGPRLEKCRDLVTFYHRRDRLAELVDSCINMHPNLLWGDIFDLLDE